MKNKILLALFCFFFLIRFIMIFEIVPGNAPDEGGHLAVVKSLSQGKILTLEQELKLSGYPYSMYNPLGYFPSSLLLSLAAKKHPELIQFPGQDLMTATIIARFGQCLWTFFYFFFLFIILKELPKSQSFFIGIILGLFPQIIFVQSYVNLDAVGIPFFLYLIWGVRSKKLIHIAVASFFLLNSKLTFLCTLALPSICFVFWYFNRPKILIKNFILYLGIPLFFGSFWSVFNHYHNLTSFGGHSVLTTLREIYHGEAPRFTIFTVSFLKASLASAFAGFGWMNQWLPKGFYFIWLFLFFLPFTSFLWIETKIREKGGSGLKEEIPPSGTERRDPNSNPSQIQAFINQKFRSDIFRNLNPLYSGLLGVFILNFVAHYYAGFTTANQPQGRYLLPAVICAIFGSSNLLTYLEKKRSPYGRFYIGFAVLFFTVALCQSVFVMRENPFDMGFGISKPAISQESQDNLIKISKDTLLLEQPFKGQFDKIYEISVLFAKKKKTLSGNLEIQILDSSRKVLMSRPISLNLIIHSAYFNIHLKEPLKIKSGGLYFLVIRGDRISPGNEFALFASKGIDPRYGSALLDGKPLAKTLTFRIFDDCHETTSFSWPFHRKSC